MESGRAEAVVGLSAQPAGVRSARAYASPLNARQGAGLAPAGTGVVLTPWMVAVQASTPPARSNAVWGSSEAGSDARSRLAEVHASNATSSRSRCPAVAAPGSHRAAVAASRRPASS